LQLEPAVTSWQGRISTGFARETASTGLPG